LESGRRGNFLLSEHVVVGAIPEISTDEAPLSLLDQAVLGTHPPTEYQEERWL
jgi:hypothetical protein